jgi:hypothetical protein
MVATSTPTDINSVKSGERPCFRASSSMQLAIISLFLPSQLQDSSTRATITTCADLTGQQCLIEHSRAHGLQAPASPQFELTEHSRRKLKRFPTDCTVQTSDGVEFRLSKSFLSAHSEVFGCVCCCCRTARCALCTHLMRNI